MVHSVVLFVLICTANWFDLEGLNTEVDGLTSEVGVSAPSPASLTLTTTGRPLTCKLSERVYHWMKDFGKT